MRFDRTDKNERSANKFFGSQSYNPAFAPTITVTLGDGNLNHFVRPQQLTGDVTTLDADLSKLTEENGQFEKVVFIFEADGTQRTVTPDGTNIVGSAITVPLNSTKIVTGYIDGGAIILQQ